ncbi:MAG: hypothetical protein JW924_10040 [Fusobacteriaceae bacterium]|nr:hypothetical protein [Fusobacteriaceae bacterium]
MKKYIIYFILIGSSYSINLKTEISTKYTSDLHSNETPISLKLNGEYSADDIYSEVEIKGSTKTEEIELTKIYVEYYKDKYTLTFGRQPIVWGNAYIFNKLNNLTSINMLNPNEKTATLDGVKMKYSKGNERVEGIVFDIDDSSDNYAIRYTNLIGNYELMLNYIKKNADLKVDGSESANDIILDLKGDLGIGIWTQYAYNFDNKKNFYLMGIDYSFAINEKTLYLLYEGSYDENKDLFLNYGRYEYGFNEWNSLKGGLLNQEKNNLLTTTISHKLNDSLELNLSHIYVYLDNDSQIGKKLSSTYSRNNIELEIKAIF